MSISQKVGLGAMLLLVLVGCSSGPSGVGQAVADEAAGGASVQSNIAKSAPAAKMGGAMVRLSSTQNGVDSGGSSRVASPRPQQASLVTQQRSIIRKAEISVRVDSVEKAEKSVDKMVAAMGGYVDSASSTDLASEHPSISLTLRVPVGVFDQALDRFEALGVRLSKTISSDDVTSQMVDLEARLKTLSATEETYRELLRQTHQLQNVIDLQDKLTEVRSQIESMAAQRKAMAGLASLSTVTLTLQQSATPVQAPADPNWLAQTWGESTSRLGGVMRSAASIGIWALVFCPIWAPVLWFARRSYRAAAKPPVRAEA